MLAAYGRPHARVAGADASHSRRLDRGTFGRAPRKRTWCADRVRLTEAPQRTRESSLCTCIHRCKLCRLVKPFVRVEAPWPLPKGPVAKAVIVYFMALANRVHMCAPQSTPHTFSKDQTKSERPNRQTRNRARDSTPQWHASLSLSPGLLYYRLL